MERFYSEMLGLRAVAQFDDGTAYRVGPGSCCCSTRRGSASEPSRTPATARRAPGHVVPDRGGRAIRGVEAAAGRSRGDDRPRGSLARRRTLGLLPRPRRTTCSRSRTATCGPGDASAMTPRSAWALAFVILVAALIRWLTLGHQSYDPRRRRSPPLGCSSRASLARGTRSAVGAKPAAVLPLGLGLVLKVFGTRRRAPLPRAVRDADGSPRVSRRRRVRQAARRAHRGRVRGSQSVSRPGTRRRLAPTPSSSSSPRWPSCTSRSRCVRPPGPR